MMEYMSEVLYPIYDMGMVVTLCFLLGVSLVIYLIKLVRMGIHVITAHPFSWGNYEDPFDDLLISLTPRGFHTFFDLMIVLIYILISLIGSLFWPLILVLGITAPTLWYVRKKYQHKAEFIRRLKGESEA